MSNDLDHKKYMKDLLRFASCFIFSSFASVLPKRHEAENLPCCSVVFPSISNKMTEAPEEGIGKAEAIWDPVNQIYVGGVVPENARVQDLLKENDGVLRIFGYGSLCWKPSGILANENVKSTLGRAKGYRRCWSQKSTDHRGNPSFPGIVCTLLKDDEVYGLREKDSSIIDEKSLTEGVLYEVPPDLVQDCLDELDFREKGGYARDIIDVVEDGSGKLIQALLYRGTPDNPAFWSRALRDLPFAAAVMSSAIGPSGKNADYLQNLDDFLERNSEADILQKFDDTFELARMVKHMATRYSFHFLFGSGSNQHNQLLLESEDNVAALHSGEDAHLLTEICLCTQKGEEFAHRIYTGGGHSGILMNTGSLYLFGWDDDKQCGTPLSRDTACKQYVVNPLRIQVADCALGFAHTLVIQRETMSLFTFGNNKKGQCGHHSDIVTEPLTPEIAIGRKIVDVSAGLFHSAAVTTEGALLSLGKVVPRCPQNNELAHYLVIGDSKIVNVACGRKHTVFVDDAQRVWSFGDNKYGQLGRSVEGADMVPGPIEGPWASEKWDHVRVKCGWSHTLIICHRMGFTCVYGVGRSDRGQLGTGRSENAKLPVQIFGGYKVQKVTCGSESSAFVDDKGQVFCCGWNEHGNLASGSIVDIFEPALIKGAPITTTPGYGDDTCVDVAMGGGHLLAMRTIHG